MSVAARGASWQASVRAGGKRYRRDFPTRTQAEDWETAAKAAILKGEEPPMETGRGSALPGYTLGDLRDTSLRRFWAGTGGEATAMVNARRLVSEIGASAHPRTITSGLIADLVAKWKRQGAAGGTINRRLAALSKMLNLAVDEGVIATMPKIPRQKESEGRLRFISEAEEALILGYFGQVFPAMGEFTVVALDTGFRLGELRALAPEHVDGDWLYLAGEETKSGRERRIPMTARVKEILTRRAGGKAREEGLFPELTTAKHRRSWELMVDKLGLSDVVFHTCRHTFCSRLVQRGVPIHTVQRLAGHSTILMTQRYAKLVDRNLTEAMMVLQGLGSQATAPVTTVTEAAVSAA